MNIIIGQVATGDKFYVREKLIKKLWKKIKAGNNILMSAPRRIGKTSIMMHCLDNPHDNYYVVYLITESVNSKNDFYKKLVRAVYDKLSASKKVSSFLKRVVDSTKIKSIGVDGFSFENSNSVDYHIEFVNIVEQLELNDYKLVIMIDEFAQTVENIMLDEGNRSAVNFLESVREIRIKPKMREKLQFIFAGSIGLENIVAQLNANSTINDLNPFTVTPYSFDEALEYISNVLNNSEEDYGFNIDDRKYLLNKLQWNISYFINIILGEIEEICDNNESNVVSPQVIDEAFDNALKNRVYFEHWHTRLRKSYKSDAYNFVKDVLNKTASKSELTKAEISDMAVGYGLSNSYNEIVNTLVFDGYINNQADVSIYVFNSPLLKQWWFNNVTN